MILVHNYDCPWNFGHDCTCGAGNSSGDTIHTGNRQSLANALKRIKELESQYDWLKGEYKSSSEKACNTVTQLQSQRDRLLTSLKQEHQYAVYELGSWTKHNAKEQCAICTLIREIEGENK